MAQTPEVEREFNRAKVVEFVKKRHAVSRQASAADLDRLSVYYKLFRGKQTKKNYQGLANLFVPEPYRIVSKKTARLSNAIRSIKAIPQSPNDVQNAKPASHLLNFLRDKLNWYILERSAIQEARAIGLSWIKVLWNLDKEEDDKPYMGFDLSFETVDKVYVDPDATALDLFTGNFKYLIHEYKATLADLRKNPNYKPADIDALKLKGDSKPQENSLSQARLSYQGQKAAKKNNDVKSFKILEYWGKYQEKQDGPEEDYLIVLADDSVDLRFEKNPYAEITDNPIPFVPVVGNPIGQELFPVGDLEPAESLFNELNDTRNQRMDTVTLNIDPAKEIVRGAQIDEKELIARRGWVIHSNIPSGVRFIPPDMQGVAAAVNEENFIRGDIQQVTGVLDFSPGSDVQAGVSIDTARGAVIAKGEADVLGEDELQVTKLSLKILYRKVLAYAQAFLDRQFVIRIFENGAESFLNIDKGSIAGNLDLDIEMKTLQDKTTEQQLALMLFNQAKEVPGAKLGKFFTDVLETFKDKVNIAEYYEEPQPVGPPPPSVSVSLRGELNALQVADISVQAGAKPESGDPLLDPTMRELMRGNMPENDEKQTKQLEILAKQHEIMSALSKPDATESE